MIPVKILSIRYLPGAEKGLAKALGAPEGYPCIAMLTTDCDDATYIALDEATKAADVKVCYARSFYAGAGNASTPNAGEVIGILAAPTPGAMRSGMDAAIAALERLGFDILFGLLCDLRHSGHSPERVRAHGGFPFTLSEERIYGSHQAACPRTYERKMPRLPRL